MVGTIRKHCYYLRDHFDGFADAFFGSCNKVCLGIHRPCSGIYVQMRPDFVQLCITHMRGFTDSYAIRKTSDLARPV